MQIFIDPNTYDKYSLSKLLSNHGFDQINISSYGRSMYINNIKDVECTSEGIPSIYLEAFKP